MSSSGSYRLISEFEPHRDELDRNLLTQLDPLRDTLDLQTLEKQYEQKIAFLEQHMAAICCQIKLVNTEIDKLTAAMACITRELIRADMDKVKEMDNPYTPGMRIVWLNRLAAEAQLDLEKHATRHIQYVDSLLDYVQTKEEAELGLLNTRAELIQTRDEESAPLDEECSYQPPVRRY